MKDELKGKIINEFVRLKSKMYSLVGIDGEEIKKAKGVNKSVVKSIRHLMMLCLTKNNET